MSKKKHFPREKGTPEAHLLALSAHAQAATAHAHAASAHALAAAAHAAQVDPIREEVYGRVRRLSRPDLAYPDDEGTQIADLISDDQGMTTLTASMNYLLENHDASGRLDDGDIKGTTTMSGLVSLVKSKL